jgi:hypothetical protein
MLMFLYSVIFALFLSFTSCASTPPVGAGKVSRIPSAPELIMGRGRVESDALAAFLLAANPKIEGSFARRFARIYVDEAAAEGVNHDVAFSQMCLETGFLNFGGLVRPEMNNFAGLGAIGPGQEGECFPSAEIGVRAQIQHLKAYATEEPLNKPLVDTRYRLVRYGSAKTIHGLAGTWAADRDSVPSGSSFWETIFFALT